MRGQRIRRRDAAAIACLVAALAFAVRLLWILRVQSPHDAVYSDMAGYVERAEELIGLRPPNPEPRMLAFWPWGAHVLYAAEFALLGRNSTIGLAIVHALVGAIPPACVVLVTARAVPSRLAGGLAGTVAALWHPQITYAAFFMSELWFTAALMVATWLFLRHAERRTGSLGAGCALAVAFVVRPQVLLTAALVGLAFVPAVLRSVVRLRVRWRSVGRWALVVLPVVIAVAGSSWRLRRLSGRVGLISENDNVMLLFGSTSIGRIEASWTTPSGGRYSAWFSPQMNLPIKRPEDLLRFEGYVADPEILARVRNERVRQTPLSERLVRMRRNVEHLVQRNYPNPEEDFARKDFRRAWLQRTFRRATLALLPLALLGLWSMRRRGIVCWLVLANFVTVVVTAAFFYAEARYRVPYDPFLVIAATAGAAAVVRRQDRFRRAFSCRRRATAGPKSAIVTQA